MSRTKLMSFGFLLIFIGIQLHIVQSFTLTPRVSNFLNDGLQQNPNLVGGPGYAPQNPAAPFDANRQNYNSPYYQASYSNQAAYSNPAAVARPASTFGTGNRTIVPPRWICWPVLFLGAVFILQGALRR